MENVNTWYNDILTLRINKLEKYKKIGEFQREIDQLTTLRNKMSNECIDIEMEVQQLVGKIKATDPDFSFKKVIYSNE